MNTLRLFQGLLVIHLAGLTVMAGTNAVSFVAFRKLSNSLHEDPAAVKFYIKRLMGLSGLLPLGGILLISSGVGLLIITHAYGQLWFQLKMGVVVALVGNGFLFGARQELKIKPILSMPDGPIHLQLRRPLANLRIFYAIQLTLFGLAILLAVTKPG
ncbi:MAG TPA: hypothetical protein VHE34_02730 [Puia sp.]|uniref:hypothetical protein n=1 Tax=Puia sp. TaxID=2045100 RepID=UPI002C212193|nr:hypothetical protein [Puia sp.]HVU94104.1 hypothetical protein [Puia sp.]